MKKRGFIVAFTVFTALAFTACGHGDAERMLVDSSFASLSAHRLDCPSQSIDGALAQLDALQPPQGVDSELYDKLKDALKNALSKQGVKSVSTPPTGEANRINDLAVADNGDGTYSLTWHYRNQGDYDQNGTVGISDITPLAQHFGETYNLDTESNSIQAVIDGSGNGKVGIEDITPIAMNFGVSVAQYSVKGADALAGPYVESATESIGEPVSDARKVLTANIGASPQGYWRVAPEDTEGAQGEASNIAGIALQVVSVTPTEVKEGTVVTFSAEVLGAGPFTYEWDFGSGAQYETYNEPAPRVVLTRETGGFPSSLTVTGPTGADTFPFTLSKLAREWKYEVIAADISATYTGLCWAAGSLWVYVGEGSMAPPPVSRYLYSGYPGDWEAEETEYFGHLAVNSQGEPAFAGYYGNLFEEDLYYVQKVDGQWLLETVEEKPFLTWGDFAFAAGDVPFIAYVYQRSEPTVAHELRYARKVDGAWERGLIDEGGEPGSFSQWIKMAVDREGNPAVCYGTEGKLWLTRWNNVQEQWDKEVVDEPATSEWFVGGFPVLDFDGEGRPAIAYENTFISEFSEIPKECVLVYAVRESDGWHKEIIASCSRPQGAPEPYKPWGLGHDPLGEPLLAYLNDDVDSMFTLIWRKEGVWSECSLSPGLEETSFEQFTLTPAGIPYMLMRGITTEKEVILTWYE